MDERQNGSQRNVDVALRARHSGQQFVVTLKAIKAGVGLVLAPCKLTQGEPIVLQPTGLRNQVNTVQLFASVGREYAGRNLFVLHWEKATSPTGMTALLEFLQTVLAVCVNGSAIPSSGPIDGELAFYDFHTGHLAVPSRGMSCSGAPDGIDGHARRTQDNIEALVRRTQDDINAHARRTQDNIEALVRRTQDDINAHARRTGPITRDGLIPGHGVANGSTQRGAAVPTGAAARPGPAPRPAGPGHDDDVVDMFGVKVSRAAWEQLENVRYSGASPAADKARELARREAERNRTGAGPHPHGEPHPDPDGKDDKRKGSSLLRRLAAKLADKD